jgi:ABC-type glycerol-3-phosphate transport system substrate-binding protein
MRDLSRAGLRPMTRRVLIERSALGLGGLTLAGWLAACGGSGEERPEAGPGTTGTVPPADLTMWWWGEQNYPDEGAVIQRLIATYEQKHPGTTVKEVLQGTDETIPAYQAAAKAKKGPDIATLWYGAYMFTEVWKGSVEPLSDHIPASETDHWLESKFNIFDGKIWASGVSGDGAAILYNKDHFRKAGLDPDNPPTNWADLVSACESLKAAGFTPISSGVKDGWFGVVWMNFVIPQLAGGSPSTLLKDAVSGEVSWTDDRLANMWERVNELKQRGLFNDNITSLGYFEGKEAFDAGRASITFTGAITFAIHSVNKAGADKVGIMAAPDLEDNPGGFIPGMPLAEFITPFTGDKEAAAAFLTWLHQPDAQQMMFEESQGAMIPIDDRFDYSQVSPDWLKRVYDQVVEAMKREIPYADGIVPYGILEAGPMKSMTLTFAEDQPSEKSASTCQESAEAWGKLNPELVDLYEQWAV